MIDRSDLARAFQNGLQQSIGGLRNFGISITPSPFRVRHEASLKRTKHLVRFTLSPRHPVTLSRTPLIKQEFDESSILFHLHPRLYPRSGRHSPPARGRSRVQRRAHVGLARQASERSAAVALFPELGISAYTNEDLFHQDALLDASTEALGQVVEDSRELCAGAARRRAAALRRASSSTAPS